MHIEAFATDRHRNAGTGTNWGRWGCAHRGSGRGEPGEDDRQDALSPVGVPYAPHRALCSAGRQRDDVVAGDVVTHGSGGLCPGPQSA
nr:hypothetical protein [Nocardia brevicatena]